MDWVLDDDLDAIHRIRLFYEDLTMKPTKFLDHPHRAAEIANAVRLASAIGEPKFAWRRLAGELTAAVGWTDNRQVGVVTLVDHSQRERRWMWTLLHDEAGAQGVATTGWAPSALEAAIQVEARYQVLVAPK